MKSEELGAITRKNAKLLAQIQQLELEIQERQGLIERLKLEMNESTQITGKGKVTPGVCACVKDSVQRGYSYSEIGRTFGISKTTVSLIVNNKYQTKSLMKAR